MTLTLSKKATGGLADICIAGLPARLTLNRDTLTQVMMAIDDYIAEGIGKWTIKVNGADVILHKQPHRKSRV
jgi:hypothetical protein